MAVLCWRSTLLHQLIQALGWIAVQHFLNKCELRQFNMAFGALTTALAGAVAVSLVAATASTSINVLKSKVYRSRDFSNPKLINNLLRLSI